MGGIKRIQHKGRLERRCAAIKTGSGQIPVRATICGGKEFAICLLGVRGVRGRRIIRRKEPVPTQGFRPLHVVPILQGAVILGATVQHRRCAEVGWGGPAVEL